MKFLTASPSCTLTLEAAKTFSPAVAIEGFRELGLALEKARKRLSGRNALQSVAIAYLGFAASLPAMYEAMFTLRLGVPFDHWATIPELQVAFSQLRELFQGQGSNTDVLSELFWASLHGIAELTRTKRFPYNRQKERVKALIELFHLPEMNETRVMKARWRHWRHFPVRTPMAIQFMSRATLRHLPSPAEAAHCKLLQARKRKTSIWNSSLCSTMPTALIIRAAKQS